MKNNASDDENEQQIPKSTPNHCVLKGEGNVREAANEISKFLARKKDSGHV